MGYGYMPAQGGARTDGLFHVPPIHIYAGKATPLLSGIATTVRILSHAENPVCWGLICPKFWHLRQESPDAQVMGDDKLGPRDEGPLLRILIQLRKATMQFPFDRLD